MDKAPDAFRTISEVADDLKVPQHVLRFWETRFSQIKPMKRGGGRRYYRPDDIDLLRGIRTLLYSEGYTIRGVQRILKEQGPRFVIAAGKGAPAPADDDEADDLPPIRPTRRAPPVHAMVDAAAGPDHDADDTEADDDEAIEDAGAEDGDVADDDGAEDDGVDDEGEDEDGEDDAAVDDDDDDDSDGDDGDSDDEEDDDADDGDADDEREPARPAFNPREFRSRATPTAQRPTPTSPQRAAALAPEDFRRLNATLADLLELKRILDQARG